MSRYGVATCCHAKAVSQGRMSRTQARLLVFSFVLVPTFASISALRCSAISAFRIPKAMLDSYIVWYAAIVMWISSRTRSNSSPRSAQLIVTCLISSSSLICVSVCLHGRSRRQYRE